MVHEIDLGQVTIELREGKATEDGRGYTTVKSGTRTARVSLFVDTAKVAHKAKLAAGRRSLKTTLAEGGLVFKVVDFKDEMLPAPPSNADKVADAASGRRPHESNLPAGYDTSDWNA